MAIFRPSMHARMMEPTTAFLAAALTPARMARMPPVAPPAIIAFQGSSYSIYIYVYIYVYT
jgi:hypothetical protein